MDGERMDATLQALGRWGRWQILQAVWLSLTYVPLAFLYTSIVFIGYEPGYSCADTNASDTRPSADNGSDTGTYKQCQKWDSSANISTPCRSHYVYSQPRYISIVSEWDLVCEWAYLVQLSQTVLSLGQITGNVILPLADRYGRKRTLVVCHYVMLVTSGAMALSPNILFFIILKFIGGFLIPAVNIVMCMMLLELFPVKQRAKVAMVSKFMWAGGVMALTLVAYLFRNTSWRYLQLCLSAFFLLAVVHTFITEESVRWLFAVNRGKEAIAILKRAAKFNGISFRDKVFPLLDGVHFGSITVLSSQQELQLGEKPHPETNPNGHVSLGTNDVLEKVPIPPTVPPADSNPEGTGTGLSANNTHVRVTTESQDIGENEKMLVTAAEDDSKPKILDLFRHKTLRKYVFISGYVMTVDILMYYGLLLMSSSLAGNRFVNVMLSGAVEIPAYILCLFLLDRFGRKACLFGFHVFAGGMLVVAVIFSATKGPDLCVTAFATLGKFGSCGCLMVSFLHSSEVIPTNLRALGMAIGGGIANIGALLAPFSSYVIQFSAWVPGTVFAVCCGTVLILLFLLPETRGRELPQTLADLDEWIAKKRRHQGDDTSGQAQNKAFQRLTCCK